MDMLAQFGYFTCLDPGLVPFYGLILLTLQWAWPST